MPSNALAESFVTLLDWALRWWLSGRDPGLALIRDNVTELRPVMRWVGAVALALAIVAAGVLLMVRRRGADLADLTLGVGRFVVALSAGWLVFASGWALCDALGSWILGGRPDAGPYVDAVTTALSDAEPAIAMTLSVLGMAAVLGFVAVVLARFVIAVLLVAGIPAVAAASVFRGAGSLRVALAWLLAVLAFRPLSAIIYRVSHDLVTMSREPIVVLLVVTMTFLLSAAMLPGVARLAANGRSV